MQNYHLCGVQTCNVSYTLQKKQLCIQKLYTNLACSYTIIIIERCVKNDRGENQLQAYCIDRKLFALKNVSKAICSEECIESYLL